ncbi:MAG: PHP domain-containing protein [Clostridia bacterium]|nr:PHP domain-containing protein [Clostridia bacterium]
MKLELHAHTSEVSPCGTVPASELIEFYKKKGFDGVVICDHFRESFFKLATDRENVDAFLKGYHIAKETGDKIGIRVYLGAELKLTSHPANEYLLYGIDEEFLYSNPRIFELPIDKVREIVNGYGAVIIQAHPYRNGVCEPVLDVDGYEVFNGHFCHKNDNMRAYELALETEKLQTSGSDSHWHCDIGNGGIEIEKLPEQRELGNLLKSAPFCIKSAMQHIKIMVLSGNGILDSEKLCGVNAVLCINGAEKPKADAPVFSDGDEDFCNYFAQNRYYIFKGKAPDDLFDPSICIGGSTGITAFEKGKEANVSRIPGHYTVTLPENSTTLMEFFGYRPFITECNNYDSE